MTNDSAWPRRFDLNLLALFDAIHRTGSLTAAGQRLGLSQPAVSHGLARLRAQYGDPLFVRIQRGVAPTPLADGLAAPVAQALALLRGTLSPSAFDPTQAKRVFRVAMSDIGERFFLPRLLALLAREAPGSVVQTLSVGTRELLDGLADGNIDLAVGFSPALGKQVHQQRLFTEEFVYVMRAGHPALAQPLTLATLRTLRHVVASPPGTEHLSAVEKVLTSPRVRADIALRVQSFLSIGPIVAETDLVAPVPSNLAPLLIARSLDLASCAPPIRFPSFDICSYWHARMHREPASVWLRGVFWRQFGQSGGPAPGS